MISSLKPMASNFIQSAKSINHVTSSKEVMVSWWSVDRNSVSFQNQDAHTLSLYLTGGITSFRSDRPAIKGSPKSFCQMPCGHESSWKINDQINFVHLYFSDRVLNSFAAIHFDCDVRFIELQDLLYQHDTYLLSLFVDYIQLCENKEHPENLAAETILYAIFDHLLTNYNNYKPKLTRIRGGLSATHRKAVKALIQDSLAEKLSLADLSEYIGLSPFHFARMFKLSFDEAPAAYVTKMRIEKVKQLLIGNRSLADISVLTGFTHQSHMTHQFRQSVGVTPAKYKQAIGS